VPGASKSTEAAEAGRYRRLPRGNDRLVDRDLLHVAAELYALPPAEYTAARNARAKALRKEQPELAAAVAKLPKPTTAAAALNRVARDDPSEVRALVQAGRALRSAQEAAVAGKSAGAVADATREHRAALDRVRRELRRLDLSDTVFERASATARAASVDPDLQPLLERGVLVREEEGAGFGLDASLVPAQTAPRRQAPRRDEAKRSEAAKAARARLAAARKDARAAAQEVKRLERELAAARAAAEAAEAAVAEAEAGADAGESG